MSKNKPEKEEDLKKINLSEWIDDFNDQSEENDLARKLSEKFGTNQTWYKQTSPLPPPSFPFAPGNPYQPPSTPQPQIAPTSPPITPINPYQPSYPNIQPSYPNPNLFPDLASFGYDKDLNVRIEKNVLSIGNLKISLERTLRLPDDGKNYPLPPSLGSFPLKKVSDYKETVPKSWENHQAAFFLPLYQREALWINFNGLNWRPNALQVIAGGINALTGKPDKDSSTLKDDPENFLVVPQQPWLDGWNSGKNKVNQFVAMPLGKGYSAEEQILGTKDQGSIRFRVFDPKEDAFQEPKPNPGFNKSMCNQYFYSSSLSSGFQLSLANNVDPGMGLASGGSIEQEIYQSVFPFDVWDLNKKKEVVIYLVNSLAWYEITSEAMPETPVSAEAYNKNKLPFYKFYNEEGFTPISGSNELSNLKTVKEIDQKKKLKHQNDKGFIVHTEQEAKKPEDR